MADGKRATTDARAERATVHARDRAAWRRWLERNHDRADGVWLVRYKKASGKPSVSYDDAVEEALCFGWIDGQLRPVDDHHHLQLFTPRRPRSGWAASNKARVQKLMRAGLMREAGLAVVKAAKASGAWTALDAVESLEVPPELARALAKNSKARKNFDAFTPSARKQFLYWLANAKREETRAKRVGEIVRLSAAGIKLQDARERGAL